MPSAIKYIEQGDYALAYLSLFQQLVEAVREGGKSEPYPADQQVGKLPALDPQTLHAHANGNPWMLARLLGYWLARQTGQLQLRRTVQIGAREYWLFPVGHPAAAWPENHPRHWFHPFWPVPRFLPLTRQKDTFIEVVPLHLRERIADSGPSKPVPVKVFAVEFCDGVALNTHDAPGRFHCTGLGDEERRWQSIEEALQDAAKKKAGIVLMPELSVTPGLRQKLAAWLVREKSLREKYPLRLVVAGSFHEKNETGAHVNRCVLLHGNGRKLGEFEKWLPYVSKKEGMENREENIVGGTRMVVINTPAGLWSASICLDFLLRREDARELHPEFPWNCVSGDLLLVASMGHESTIKGHKARATALVKEFYPRVVVANIPPESDGKYPGFIAETSQDKVPSSRDNTPPHSMWPPLRAV